MRLSAQRAGTLLLILFAVLVSLPAVAASLKVGDKAPDFELAATTGGEIRLSDYRGTNMVLLEFYHADWGPT
jgi:peroxiredoxin Q/BCP